MLLKISESHIIGTKLLQAAFIKQTWSKKAKNYCWVVRIYEPSISSYDKDESEVFTGTEEECAYVLHLILEDKDYMLDLTDKEAIVERMKNERKTRPTDG